MVDPVIKFTGEEKGVGQRPPLLSCRQCIRLKRQAAASLLEMFLNCEGCGQARVVQPENLSCI